MKKFYLLCCSFCFLSFSAYSGDFEVSVPGNGSGANTLKWAITQANASAGPHRIWFSQGGEFDFATSNEMWRASLDILSFMPLTSADYGGGLIITDWYTDGQNVNDDSIKISVRFLSNEIQSNSIKIIVHKKDCNVNQTCLVKKIDSKIEDELRRSILQKAALLEKEGKKKNGVSPHQTQKTEIHC